MEAIAYTPSLDTPELFKLAGQVAERLVASALQAMIAGPGARIVVSVEAAPPALEEPTRARRALPAAVRAHKPAKRQLRAQRPQPRAPKRAAAVPPPTGRAAVVDARDEAIRAHLTADGPAKTSDLLGILPREPGQTSEQREAACRNALTRLQAKKQIRGTPDGWVRA